MLLLKKFVKSNVPIFTLVALALAAFSAASLALSVFFTPVADFFENIIGTPFRILTSAFTSFLGFSVFEVILCLVLPLIILIAVLAARKIRTKKQALRFAFGVIALPAFIFSGFVFSLGIPYHTRTLENKMALPSVTLTAENLAKTAIILRDNVNFLAEELRLSEGSASSMKMSFSDLSTELSDAYGAFAEKYGFPFNFYTRAKPLVFDEVMSRAHLLGIYTFFTGESNINDGYPDYTVVNTVAHEFAHQRGIIREDEANFMAFAVCIGSDNPYIKYAGYLNMYEYVVSALYDAEEQAFRTVHSGLSKAALSDVRAYSEKAKQYRDTALGEVVGNVNDAYLQMNGTEGTVSYSLCVRLAVAYYHNLE